MKYLTELESAKKIIIESGHKIKGLTDKKIESEFGKDIKTEADKESEKIIIENLSAQFDYPILSEESYQDFKKRTNDPYWIIDPIDGTLNFIHNFEFSCISIAFWIENEPVFGLVYDFNKDQLYEGVVDSGAKINNRRISKPKVVPLNQAILATGFPTYLQHDENTLREYIGYIQKFKKIRLLGSAALSICYVAKGVFDAYYEKDIKLWDIAAGVAIIKSMDIKYNLELAEDYKCVLTVKNWK